jgi:hypothetical protein
MMAATGTGEEEGERRSSRYGNTCEGAAEEEEGDGW